MYVCRGGFRIKSLAKLHNKKFKIFNVMNCKRFSSRVFLLCCFDVLHIASNAMFY